MKVAVQKGLKRAKRTDPKPQLLEAANRVAEKNLLNIFNKSAAGRPLSRYEQQTIDNFRAAQAGPLPMEPQARYGSLPKFATTKPEAAQVLDLASRNYFVKWRRMYPDAPREPADHSEPIW